MIEERKEIVHCCIGQSNRSIGKVFSPKDRVLAWGCDCLVRRTISVGLPQTRSAVIATIEFS